MIQNIKSVSKIHLRMIIELYKDYSMKAGVSISPRSQSQKSPSSSQASRHDIYQDRSRSPLDFATYVIHQESHVGTSNDSFDEQFPHPVIASNKPISDPQTPTPTSSLVTLLRVKPLDHIQIITPSISLNEKNCQVVILF
ncbi:hypothetical protein LOD99_786 [Oopsacas minuta]|uniref:Uncharacterized protein n=1 Tax=Oopsacas minuta TaxID=111878 RepID=A0AAV7JZK1_9METZ|nr:hypothetical protein LOD99_786 [Oopsacas minuta]